MTSIPSGWNGRLEHERGRGGRRRLSPRGLLDAHDHELGQLAVREVHAAVSGSGRIVTHAANTLQASVPGSGTIIYSGNPAHVTTSITGSGAITRQ